MGRRACARRPELIAELETADLRQVGEERVVRGTFNVDPP
jgi:hypothetical protein